MSSWGPDPGPTPEARRILEAGRAAIGQGRRHRGGTADRVAHIVAIVILVLLCGLFVRLGAVGIAQSGTEAAAYRNAPVCPGGAVSAGTSCRGHSTATVTEVVPYTVSCGKYCAGEGCRLGLDASGSQLTAAVPRKCVAFKVNDQILVDTWRGFVTAVQPAGSGNIRTHDDPTWADDAERTNLLTFGGILGALFVAAFMAYLIQRWRGPPF